MGRRKKQDLRLFLDAVDKYGKGELNQKQAAEYAGMCQRTFYVKVKALLDGESITGQNTMFEMPIVNIDYSKDYAIDVHINDDFIPYVESIDKITEEDQTGFRRVTLTFFAEKVNVTDRDGNTYEAYSYSGEEEQQE